MKHCKLAIRIILIIAVAVMALLIVSCLPKGESTGTALKRSQLTTAASQTESETWNPEAAKAELKKLPQNYEPEKAIEDGCFVILHGKLLSDPQMADHFAADAKAGQTASLRIVQYTVEGDPIIMHVEYRDGIYHGLLDDSRDHFGGFGSEIAEYDMPCLAIFDDHGGQVAYLVKEDGLSQNDIETIINQNQDPDGPEDLVFLYLYDRR